jgi:predicted branched-subunit amino acid permease
MNTAFTCLELQEIAKYHKLLLWSIPAVIVATFSKVYLGDHPIGLPILFAATFFLIFAIYKLGRSLRLSAVFTVLFIVALIVLYLHHLAPLILILGYVHNEAMKLFKSAGVKVGLMGAEPKSNQ